METEQLNINIDKKEIQRIRQYAKETRRTKTAVVLMALEKFFKEEKGEKQNE